MDKLTKKEVWARILKEGESICDCCALKWSCARGDNSIYICSDDDTEYFFIYLPLIKLKERRF